MITKDIYCKTRTVFSLEVQWPVIVAFVLQAHVCLKLLNLKSVHHACLLLFYENKKDFPH